MIDWKLARRYQAAGVGLGGVLLKQSLYPRAELLDALEGSRVVLDFGCGEGLLTNLLARALPRTRFIATDLNAEKITQARNCQTGDNTEFHAGDFFASPTKGASAVLFNDVLHHLSPERQDRALAFARESLDGSGVLILKEVAADDALDKAHTSFWDHRIYPRDRLSFRRLPDWVELAGRHGFRLIRQSTVRHPWIASRSILVFTQRPRIPVQVTPPTPVSGPASVRVLLTGGTGFIGGWLLRELLENGIDDRPVEIGVVTRRPWTLAPALARDSRVKVLPIDLAGESITRESLGGNWDYVFHLAADVDYFGGAGTFRNNLDGTAHLLAALRESGVRRFVYASTMGAVDRAGPDRCDLPLDENSPPHPTSRYGEAKIAEEKLVRESGLPAVIVRLPWCYGPGMSRTHHVRKLLGDVRRNSLATRWAWPGRVSLAAVADVAKAFITAAQSASTNGQTFFVSDANPISFGELFAEMGHVVGNPNAGKSSVPRLIRWAARQFPSLLPFQLKALVCDALLVSNARASSLGIAPAARPELFLDPLARFDAMEDRPNLWRQYAVVTGAANGIGRALTRQLHARGHGLCAVDIDGPQLTQLCRRLDAVPRVLDLAQLDPARATSQLADAHAPDVSLVINNAGLGFRGGFADLDSSVVEAMLAVNVRAVTLSTTAFAAEMRRGGGGVIVNIASTAALQPLPYMAAYAASKAYVLSFTLAAGAEQSTDSRVRLLAVSPSGTSTNFQKAGGVKVHEDETLFTADSTAASILRAAGRERPSTILGVRGRVMALFARLAPTRTLLRTWEGLMHRER